MFREVPSGMLLMSWRKTLLLYQGQKVQEQFRESNQQNNEHSMRDDSQYGSGQWGLTELSFYQFLQ